MSISATPHPDDHFAPGARVCWKKHFENINFENSTNGSSENDQIQIQTNRPR